MSPDIRIISSMATRRLLQDVVAAFMSSSPETVLSVESVGGVDAARRVEAGEPFDLVILASGAIDTLIRGGHVVSGSRVDLVHSPIAVAVRAGQPHPPLASEDDLRRAVAAARSIGYSTGPSGDHLMRTFERWGIADHLRSRIVQATPGVPVGSLVARGDAELGFQQLSEFLHVPGIEVVGLLPPGVQSLTTFAAGTPAVATPGERVRALLAFMQSPAAAAIATRHGMEPAHM
jgi:molybdate transport system substrate-binding protein